MMAPITSAPSSAPIPFIASGDIKAASANSTPEADTIKLNKEFVALLQRMWVIMAKEQGSRTATDASYHQLVRSLRKKFEEIGLPAQSIKTLPRFGLEYLREYPQLEVAGAAEAALAPALGAIVSTPSVGAATQVLRWRGMSGGAKWSIRLLSLLLPFLAGLLIGHLGNRSDDVSMPMPVASDAVSRDPALNALRAPSAPQRSNASENRSQRT